MIFGGKSTFAIECEVRDKYDGFVYCGYQQWLANEAIGDWSEDAVLGVLVHSANVFLEYQGGRQIEQANWMTSEELFAYIRDITSACDDQSVQKAVLGRYRQRFLAHELADSVARKCRVILAETSAGAQRLVWSCAQREVIKELALPKLAVDSAVRDFVAWAAT